MGDSATAVANQTRGLFMGRSRLQGFTLIELMIAIAVLALLVAMAYPSYQRHICKVERNQAQADLLSFAQSLESFYTTNNFSYRNENGYSGAVFPLYSPADRAEGDKKFTLSVQIAQAGDSFVLTAERVRSSCDDGVFTLASNGQRQWIKGGVTLNEWEH